MGVQPQVQPMFVSSTFSMIGFHNTYGYATVSGDYVCNLYVLNHWVTFHPWVCNLKCSLRLLALPTESLCYTTLMVVQP